MKQELSLLNQIFHKEIELLLDFQKGTIVVESKDRGGSLITADLALEFNRDVYAVPGDVFSEYSKGCNNLIRDARAKISFKYQ